MRIAYISAGAGGMFCGSCLHDNTLAAALTALGHEALLIPSYTPLHTDEPDVSYRRAFLGGINAYLQQTLPLLRPHCAEIDGFIATSRYYGDFMAEYLAIPRARIDVVYPGLNLNGHGMPRPERRGIPFTIGYFARICPEKGLHNLVEAFCRLRQEPGAPRARLRVSGWLGANHRDFLNEQKARL